MASGWTTDSARIAQIAQAAPDATTVAVDDVEDAPEHAKIGAFVHVLLVVALVLFVVGLLSGRRSLA